ncbi:MAG TPA: hypothetical protein VNK96_07205 [Fimbriimonadales bacterium]|nr:hypothetical protein [Fimbriimonadales bacterium]
MMKQIMNILKTLIVLLFASFLFPVQAQLSSSKRFSQPDLTITSPQNGDFVGQTASIKYQVSGADSEITTKATITEDANPSNEIILEESKVPPPQGNITGELQWNPGKNYPGGLYHIKVEGFIGKSQTGVLFETILLDVTLDPQEPKIIDFSPAEGAFVNGTVNFSFKTDELASNVKEWKLTIDGSLAKTASGTSDFNVIYNFNPDVDDGPKTVLVSVKDLADNVTEKQYTITLDTADPGVEIKSPNSNIKVKPESIVYVVLHITGEFIDSTTGSSSVDVTGVDVELRDMNNNFIKKVPRLEFTVIGEVIQWVGRFKVTGLPNKFKVVVTVVDVAGNQADPQEVILEVG